MVVTAVCLTRDMAGDPPLPNGGCDRETVDIMNFVRRNEFLDYQRFGAPPVKGQAMLITKDRKSCTRVNASTASGRCGCRSETSRLCIVHTR